MHYRPFARHVMIQWSSPATTTSRRLLIAALCAAWLPAAQAEFQFLDSSPSKERFLQAIAAAHGSGADPVNRTCLTLPYRPERFLGPPDTSFNWTPAAFAAHVDAKSKKSAPALERMLAMFIRAGFLEPMDPLEGMPRYGLTWKGYASVGLINCFRFASSERKVVVQSFEKVRVQNGSDIYRVMATSIPEKLESWLDDPEFTALYPEVATVARGSATPVAYEVARWEGRNIVISVPGSLRTSPPDPRPKWVPPRLPPPPPETMLKQAGNMDVARALEKLRAHERSPTFQRRVCLSLHLWGVDETNFFEVARQSQDAVAGVAAPIDTPLYFTIYNAARVINDNDQRIAYDFFRRLESVGFARSTLMAAKEWKGEPARGKVRFELTPAGAALLEPGNIGCMRVGEFSVAEVLWTQDFSVGNLRPKFRARSTFTPFPSAAPLVARIGHLRRLVEIGGASHGHFYIHQDQMLLELNHELVSFHPEPGGITLPAMQAP